MKMQHYKECNEFIFIGLMDLLCFGFSRMLVGSKLKIRVCRLLTSQDWVTRCLPPCDLTRRYTRCLLSGFSYNETNQMH